MKQEDQQTFPIMRLPVAYCASTSLRSHVVSVCLYVCLPQHHFPANRTSVLPDAPMTLSHLFLAWGEGLTHGTCKRRGEEIGRKDEIMRVDGQVFVTIPWLHSGGTTWQHPGRERMGCELQTGSYSAWPRPGAYVQQK